MATRTLVQRSLLWSKNRPQYASARAVGSNLLPALGSEFANSSSSSSSFKFQQQQYRFLATPPRDDTKDKSEVTIAKRKRKPWLMDLGVPSLIPEWKKMFNPQTIGSDLAAGLTVGTIAVPLSLAIAMASGVPAEVGLATAAVSGVAGGLMGGTTLAVTGPAAAISLLVLGAVQSHGLAALPFITVTVGGLQVASGVTRLGVYAKLVPVSVIAGFTTGVGTLILSGQIPKALGMSAPAGLNPLEMAMWVGSNAGDMSLSSAALAFGTAAAMYGLPKIHPKIPAALLAVGGATAVTHMAGLDVALIGTLPSGLEAFKFAMPMLPSLDSLPSLASTTILIYLMTTVESLLSCVALDKMKKTEYKHNSDQELVGQGLANVGAGLFMGMPVTSVIARSSLNQRVGAQTRAPALIQSGFVFGSIVFASSSISMIPMPALSGMLIFTGANMLYPSEFSYCYTTDKVTAYPFFTTVAGMLSMGLAEGIGIGCATALALAVHKNMELRVKMEYDETNGDFAVRGREALDEAALKQIKGTGTMVCEDPSVATTETRPLVISPDTPLFQIRGPINFMSMFEIEELADQILERKNSGEPIVLDFRHVTSLDFTGMEEIVGRVIENADGAVIKSVTSRDDINNVMNKVDKDMVIERYSSLQLKE